MRAPDSNPCLEPVRRVLVVDDDEMFLVLAARVLTRAGYSVDAAEDGEAGWTALCGGAYDLLITDNDMPLLTGVELVMRARIAGMTLPVVMASGSSVIEALRDPSRLDLAAFLLKPFAIRELCHIASRLVSPLPALYTNPQWGAATLSPPVAGDGPNETPGPPISYARRP